MKYREQLLFRINAIDFCKRLVAVRHANKLHFLVDKGSWNASDVILTN